MATVKVKFRPSSVATKEGTLFYQVIHQRIVRQIPTHWKIYPSEWDKHSSKLVISVKNENRYDYLKTIDGKIKREIDKIKRLIVHLGLEKEIYTADEIVNLYYSTISLKGFCFFAQELIDELKVLGKRRIIETYRSSLNRLVHYLGEEEIPFEKIDSNLMVSYESYLKQSGVSPNTISFYMRNLRAIYNRAVVKGLTPQRFPFKQVYTGIDKTVKRAIPLKIIRKIRDMDLGLFPIMDYARDIFMFSFYTRGMSFIDMAFLKKKDLKRGILSYRRRKTNQQLFIKWEKPMQEIINKYDTSTTPYLLPIITDMEKDEIQQYKSALHLVNNKLKEIGKQLKLNIPLTTYVSRHGWASIAKSKNIAISVISEAMGHDSEKTTRIYLASLDATMIDKANRIILKSL